MRMVRLIIYIMYIAFAAIAPAMAQTASEVLAKASDIFENSGGMKVDFSLQTTTRSGQSTVQNCVIDLKGDKFVADMPGMEIYYDGTNQWVYVENNEEVNLTIPSGDDLALTNPILLLKYYKENFAATMQNKNSTTSAGEAAWIIDLAPKKKGNIESVSMIISKKTYMPEKITIVAKGGVKSVIKVTKIRSGVNQKDSFFVFDKNKYPDVEVIDLR